MLAGWTEVDSAFLQGQQTSLSADGLKRFYDGQLPGWQHALAPEHQVPRRNVVAGALALLGAPVGQSMVLLVASEGEGKSTALLQTAVDLVGKGHRVLFRESGTALDIDEMLALPPAAAWVLVSDDADEIASSLQEAVKRVESAGRRDIHWLLSARYEDWRARFRQGPRTVEPAWAATVDLWPDVGTSPRMLALTSEEAARLVAAWDGAGCLGALAEVAPEARAEALVEARHGSGWSAATLLDAILGQRYGPDRLKAHVARLLPRLGDNQHRFASGHTIQEAFLYAAAGAVAGVDGIDLHVMADLVGVDREDRGQVLRRLGQEGLASGSAGVLRVRHRDLARAAVQLVEEGGPGAGLEQVFKDLVRVTGETGNELRGLAAGGAVMNCGPTLALRLREIGIGGARAGQVARAAADESARALPDLLMFTVARARTYRETGQPGEARAILRAALGDLAGHGDWRVVGRLYLRDLSVSEADAGQLVDSIVLGGLSIADVDQLGDVSMAEAKVALDGLGAACSRMDAADLALPFQRLVGACALLGRQVTPKWDEPARLDFHRYEVLADELGTTQTSPAQAVAALSDALAAARRELHDEDLAALWDRLVPDPDRPPLGSLTKTVGLRLR